MLRPCFLPDAANHYCDYCYAECSGTLSGLHNEEILVLNFMFTNLNFADF